MIDKVCKQEQVTPIQAKVVNYESSMMKTRGLETDKENIQMNKLKKKKQMFNLNILTLTKFPQIIKKLPILQLSFFIHFVFYL